MRDLGLQDARPGKKIRTTIRDDGHERASDLLRRDFTATRPNERWVADFTYVATRSHIAGGGELGVVRKVHECVDPVMTSGSISLPAPEPPCCAWEAHEESPTAMGGTTSGR